MSKRTALACLALCLAAAELVQHQPPASAVLTGDKVEGDRLEVSLSGSLRLTMSVQGSPKLEVEPPEKVTQSEVWQVRPQGPATTTPRENGQVRWQQAYRIDPLQKGEQTLQMEPLRYREDGGDWQEAKWRPFAVTVTTGVARADVGEARDITSIEPVPPGRSWLPWLLGAGLAPVAVALAYVLWRLWRRPRRPVPVPPHLQALRELDRAGSMSLTTPQEVERYHTFLSGVVRRYLEDQFHLPASRRTTPEFFEAVRESPLLTAEQQALLHDFLERCDLAKFAPVTPPAEACRAAADLARRVVEDTSASTGGLTPRRS